jgi:hypothetical protein
MSYSPIRFHQLHFCHSLAQAAINFVNIVYFCAVICELARCCCLRAESVGSKLASGVGGSNPAEFFFFATVSGDGREWRGDSRY